jgi:hypothetical protein
MQWEEHLFYIGCNKEIDVCVQQLTNTGEYMIQQFYVKLCSDLIYFVVAVSVLFICQKHW